MSFTEHLRELRARIVWAVLAVCVGFGVCYYFSDQILLLLMTPLKQAIAHLQARGVLPDVDAPLHFQDPLEPFFAYLKLSLVAGIFVAAPAVFYQLWAFVAPGLYSRERRLILPLVFLGTLFFVGGGAFCYFLVLPYAMEFLVGYGLSDGNAANLAPLLMLDTYLDRAEQMLLAFGLVFELPLVVGTLAWLGVVTPRGLWKWNRHIIVAIFILSAVITPTGDPVNLLIMAVPMILLFELSVLFAVFIHRRRAKAKAAEVKPADPE